jgi:hypothetical protein
MVAAKSPLAAALGTYERECTANSAKPAFPQRHAQ